MLRVEYVVIGCVLVVLGCGLIVYGYQASRPTMAESALGFLEDLSGEQLPAGLQADHTMAYLAMGAGAAGVIGGILLIARSRSGPAPSGY